MKGQRWNVKKLFEPQKAPMNPKDRLLLSPWKKFKKYGRFPVKAVLHIVQLLLVASLIILDASEFAAYTRENYKSFTTLFAPENDRLLTTDETIDAVRQCVFKYYDFPRNSTDYYIPEYIANDTIKPVKLTVQYYESDFYDPKTRVFLYDKFGNNEILEKTLLVKEDGGREIFASIAKIITQVVQLKVSFSWVNLDTTGSLGPVPYYWDLDVLFSLKEGGSRVGYQLFSTTVLLDSHEYDTLGFFTYLNLIIAVLSILNACLSTKSLISELRTLQEMKRKYQRSKPSLSGGLKTKHGNTEIATDGWDGLSLDVKLSFINFWHLMSVASSMLLIVSSILGILSLNSDWNTTNISEQYRLFLGLGAFTACLNVLRYMEYSKRFTILIMTVKLCLANVSRFLISSFPIFFGYALFGLVCFSQYTDLFVSLDHSMVTLFAVMNGDSILDVFDDVAASYPHVWITRVYLYSFILFFITAVLNIFIFIIEDSFHAAKKWTSRHQKLKKGKKKEKKMNLGKLFEVIEKHDAPNGGEDKKEGVQKKEKKKESNTNYNTNYNTNNYNTDNYNTDNYSTNSNINTNYGDLSSQDEEKRPTLTERSPLMDAPRRTRIRLSEFTSDDLSSLPESIKNIVEISSMSYREKIQEQVDDHVEKLNHIHKHFMADLDQQLQSILGQEMVSP